MESPGYHYKLLSLRLNDGTELVPGKITVLVGPNNSGKSRALKEIAGFTTRSRSPKGIVVSSVSVSYPSSLGELRQSYDVERYQDESGNWIYRGLRPELNEESHITEGAWPLSVESTFANRQRDFDTFFAGYFGHALVAFLNTESRLQLVREGSSPADYHQSSSLLQMFYNAGSGAALEVSELVQRAFGKELALDFTIPQKLLLRVGRGFSSLPQDPRDARPLMQQFERLDEQGDGLRSFVGIAVALLVLKRGLFLIDEPEAFLHPPQAFRIGSFIAEHAVRSRQIILATHSADLLRGILSRVRDVDIIRIDRVGDANSFRRLDPGLLKEIVDDPLLTSSRVLDGLFYSGAVVVEADSDARFYQAASMKLSRDLDLHFVNADNKQTVPRIVRLYREMGVRVAGVVDFDVLNNRIELEKSLATVGLPSEFVQKLIEEQRLIEMAARGLSPEERLVNIGAKLREVEARLERLEKEVFRSPEEELKAKNELLRQMEGRFRELAELTKAWGEFKRAGRAALQADAQTAFDRIWETCARHGFFINPCGELESMLVDYGIQPTTDKKGWIKQALQIVPDLDPNDEKYPWKFLKAVHEHIRVGEQ